MSSHTIEDLTSCILDFQANMVRVTFRKKTTLVEPDFEPMHSAALQFIWEKSRLQEDREDAVTMIKWRKLGFETEDIGHEFREVGVLGLDCLVGRLPTPVKGVDAVRMLKCSLSRDDSDQLGR